MTINCARKIPLLFIHASLAVGAYALLACAILTGCSRTTATAPSAPAVPVLAASVEQKDVPVEIQAIGSVEAFSIVTVKTQITGELTDVLFKEGQQVRQGQLIFKLDERPYLAELKKQQANLPQRS